MSRSAAINLPWADGEYTFRLGFAQLIELQEEIDAGPYVILDRLRDRKRRPKDEERPDEDDREDDDEEDVPLPPRCGVREIRAVIRLGLLGGGLDAKAVGKLIRKYVEARVPEENRLVAWTALLIALHGAPEEEVGKKKGPLMEAMNSTTSPTERSGSD